MEKFTEANKKQFTDNIQHVLQKEGASLTRLVQNEAMDYETKFFDEVQELDAEDRARDAHGYTPTLTDQDTVRGLVPATKRRQLSAYICRTRCVIDQGDNLNVLLDPTSMRVKAAAWAMGRHYDQRIIKALGGTAKTGVDGANNAPLPPDTQVIGCGAEFDVTGANNGRANKAILKLSADANTLEKQGKLTLKKLLDARTRLKKNLFSHQEKMYFVCGEEQINDLLNDENLTSIDQNNVRALVKGEVNNFAGFEFITTEMLPVLLPYFRVDGNFAADSLAIVQAGGKVIRDCYAFTESAMIFGKVKNAFMSKINELPLYDYAQLIYVSDSVGSVRMNDRLVVCVKCLEDYTRDHKLIKLQKMSNNTAATAVTDLFTGADNVIAKPDGPLAKPILEATYT